MNATDDDPATDAIYDVGTLASVLQLLKLPDGTVKVLVEGNARARIRSFVDNPRFFQVSARCCRTPTTTRARSTPSPAPPSASSSSTSS